jgi:hypothetical protein
MHDQGSAAAPVRRRTAALTVLAIGMLMDLLDTSVVLAAVAAPVLLRKPSTASGSVDQHG